jgi:hypothetical protein
MFTIMVYFVEKSNRQRLPELNPFFLRAFSQIDRVEG